ncbi:MAG: hypothetical protein H0X25_07600 [Acidobacteriales bacterium]|nr:hypothetical protein [Terriglobales bacterium]
MTLLDAKQYDESRDRRRSRMILAIVILAVICGWIAYHLRNYPERHASDKFFATLKNKDFEGAYGLWLNDPAWKQHPKKYSNYSYADFYRDWGPGGEWGVINSYAVDCSLGSGSGVIVQVTVNDRTQKSFLWVSKADKSLSFSPNEVTCGNWFGWLTE